MADPLPNFQIILQTLTTHQVQFIIVGGVCGRLHGAPLITEDIDIVHSRDPENLTRLLAALQSLDAIYRAQGRRILRPRLAFLEADGPNLLMTSAGPLDVLGTIGQEQDYQALLPHTVEINMADNLKVRILDLPTLITIKEEAGREKDKAVLPILRRTLEEQGRTPPAS
jgi:hypothetical protein